MTTTSELTGGNSRRVSSTSSSASKAQGLSWVRPGTRTVFSKESSLLRIDDHDIDDADNDNKDDNNDNNDDKNDQVALARSELDSASDEENFVGRSWQGPSKINSMISVLDFRYIKFGIDEILTKIICQTYVMQATLLTSCFTS